MKDLNSPSHIWGQPDWTGLAQIRVDSGRKGRLFDLQKRRSQVWSWARASAEASILHKPDNVVFPIVQDRAVVLARENPTSSLGIRVVGTRREEIREGIMADADTLPGCERFKSF